MFSISSGLFHKMAMIIVAFVSVPIYSALAEDQAKFSLSETLDMNVNPPKHTRTYGTIDYKGCKIEIDCEIDKPESRCDIKCPCVGKGAKINTPSLTKSQFIDDAIYVCRTQGLH